MDFYSYREKLGLGFNDEEKMEGFITRILNFLSMMKSSQYAYYFVSVNAYLNFCNYSNNEVNVYHMDENSGNYRLDDCIEILTNISEQHMEFLFLFIVLLNSIEDNVYTSKQLLIEATKKHLIETHIQFELIQDEKKYFLFPKGADELDKSLVTEPLDWLKEYPKSRAMFVRVLTQYQDLDCSVETADNLRKTLELFLQEFLSNDKNLETNKNEISRLLGGLGIDSDFNSLFHQVINTYKNYNDKTAKHHVDRVDSRLLEFLLYQTGIIIRTIIVVAKGSERL